MYAEQVVPAYCRSRTGRVFRLQRVSEMTPERLRYVLRATPVRPTPGTDGHEVSAEISTALLRDKIRHHQAILTPESTYEQLWHQLKLVLDVPAG